MYGWMNGANSDIADFNPEDGYSEHDLKISIFGPPALGRMVL